MRRPAADGLTCRRGTPACDAPHAAADPPRRRVRLDARRRPPRPRPPPDDQVTIDRRSDAAATEPPPGAPTKPVTNRVARRDRARSGRARSHGRSVRRLLSVRVRRLGREDRRSPPTSRSRCAASSTSRIATSTYEHDVLEKLRARARHDPIAQAARRVLRLVHGRGGDREGRHRSRSQPLLATISKVKDAKSLSAAIAQLHAAGHRRAVRARPDRRTPTTRRR